MADVLEHLFALPEIQLTESPASWLCRVALSQGTGVKELCRHLDIPLVGDMDLIAGQWLRVVDFRQRHSRLAGLAVARKILQSLQLVDPTGSQFLLRSVKGLARYRYCPHCLAEQVHTHLPIEWRFRAWRMCPLHDCLLREGCHECKAHVLAPFDFMNTAGKEIEVGSFGQCTACGSMLRHGETTSTSDSDRLARTGWSQLMLANGRATVSALYLGRVFVNGMSTSKPLGELRRLARLGLLPHRERRPVRGDG